MYLFFIFILGLCVGSFLNVVIDRLPNGKSLGGRSYCDHCKRKLAWYDLIPVISFFILRGECGYCKKKISWQYPAVELITAILFVIVYISMYRIIDAPLALLSLTLTLIIYSGLITIFFTDFKYQIIPDEILIVVGVTTILMHLIFNSSSLKIGILSGTALFFIFLALVILTRGKGMGMGDVKYVFFMGLFLGFPASIVAFYIAFLTGAGVSLILVVRGAKRFGQTVAFGPFLVVATIVSDIWGEQIWLFFQRMIGFG